MNSADRQWELDALRGLMLVLMTLTHLPTRLADPLGQPLGFVSAAEGFVLLSAYMAGRVYTAKADRQGPEAMKNAFFNRALKLYACQLALLVFAFTVIAGLGLALSEVAITDLLSFFLERPVVAALSAGLLLYSPALLDILPIYIVFMLLSPLVLLHGMEHGWRTVMALSLLLWVGAQFGLGPAVNRWAMGWFDMPVRYQDMGAFEIFAWQFLWVLGLWMGFTHSQPGHAPTSFPRWMVGAAMALAIVGFLWRHTAGQTPMPDGSAVNLMFDKWHLGPLRLINLLALLVLVMHFAPWLQRHLPRWRVLETLGKAALPVFCAHLVAALLALAVFGPARPERPWSVDLLVLFVAFYALWITARLSLAADRRADRQRASKVPAADLSSSGAAR
ncbi:OpgC domain-containing protein [Hydrogenophaga sp. BPS33]|uniref:OpgC domain-containing protein n=1 Tax=Hydrogenophaga sp. BPS33 TaxID=2651974 RepID=UPI00131F4F29|nr:OpgC domain-containing protein [Hydrogenophaga sp. BPS33]QHE86171.1 OpgC domain-containing protein [Hydrogenophaga sp. BPS33]